MGELIYHVAVSLDHFIADQALINGDIERSLFLFDGDHVPDFLEDIKDYDAVLMGRKTYEFGFLLGAKPGEPGYKGIKHYIFSKSLQFDSNEEVELIKEDEGKGQNLALRRWRVGWSTPQTPTLRPISSKG